MEYKFSKSHLLLHLQQLLPQKRLLGQISLFQLLLLEVVSISLADSKVLLFSVCILFKSRELERLCTVDGPRKLLQKLSAISVGHAVSEYRSID